MTSSTASTQPKAPRNRSRAAFAITAAAIAVLIILFFIFSGLYADVLWFDQLGYLNVLTTQWYAERSKAVVFDAPELDGLGAATCEPFPVR